MQYPLLLAFLYKDFFLCLVLKASANAGNRIVYNLRALQERRIVLQRSVNKQVIGMIKNVFISGMSQVHAVYYFWLLYYCYNDCGSKGNNFLL